MSDYRTLLADVLCRPAEPVTFEFDLADNILAARVPELCPDCNAHGWSTVERPYPQTCDHPNAPTIGDLLRWGENVAKAEPHPGINPHVLFDHPVNGLTQYHGPIVLLAALRTEADR